MKPDSRALAQLIVYLFLSFHAVTWAGDRGPSNRIEVGAGVQFAGVGAHAHFASQRAPTETQALTKERQELLLLCQKLLEQVQKEQKKTGLSEAQRKVSEEREGKLWNILTRAIETRLVAGQGESEAPLSPPEATPAHLPQDEALAEALKAVTLCIQCLEESLAEPAVQADAPLHQIFEARRKLALLKKQQLEQALQAPATEGGEIAETRAYWHSAYQAVQARLENEASAQAVVKEAERLHREACVSRDPEQAHQCGFYFLERREQLEIAQSSYWTAEKIEETIRGHWTVAAQGGHPEAALRLLRSYKPMALTQETGAVFYQLYQLEVENQSPFPEDIRSQFLARALLAKDVQALTDLNTWINDDIAQGNTRVSARNERWRRLREVLFSFKKSDPDPAYQAMSKALLQEVQGIYQQGEKKTLCWLKEVDSDYESESDSESPNKRVAQEIEKIKRELQEAHEQNLYRKLEEKISEHQQALSDQEAKFQTELSQKEQALKTLETQRRELAQQRAQGEQDLRHLQAELASQQASYQAYRLARQESRERKAQEIVALREQLAELQAEKAEQAPAERMTGQAYQLGQPGDPGFGVGAVPEGCLPPDFSSFPGSEEIDSDEYGNYRHAVAGVHVWIPAFVYRVGESASAALLQKYGAHAIEVQDFRVYLAGLDAPARTGLTARLAQGQRGPEGWQLHRAFVNAGEVQAGFFIQKYLASKHENGQSVTSQKNRVPLSLTSWDGYTRSKDMPGCEGVLRDAYVLAKQTSKVHQVASIFQYSALTMLSLAQAQGATSNQHCAWWSADPRGCCPKGCSQDLHDDQEVNLGWQSAGEPGDPSKPRTGSCSDLAWTSHNGQGNGVMDIKGALWETAGAVTTGSDTNLPETLWALAREVDYIRLNQDTAFGHEAQLRARGDVPVCLPYRVDRRLDGTFALFSGDGTYDALALPKSLEAEGLVWPGYDDGYLYTAATFANLMPLVGGSWWGGDAAGLCARIWVCTWRNRHGIVVGLRLAAYGLTWSELAGASGG